MRLEMSTWLQVEEYFKTKDMVIIPVGSIENHGSHLALGTDYLIPSHLVGRLDQRLDVLFAPAMPFGVADHHIAFPGTISIGVDGLYLVLSKVVESLYSHGARKFVFLNGHGGNDPVFNRLGLEMNQKGALCAVLNWWSIAGELNADWKGGHGGAEETSAMMVIHPQAVQPQAIRDCEPQDLSSELAYVSGNLVDCDGIKITVPRLVNHFSAPGWFGPDHPATATKEWGEEMLQAVEDFFVSFLEKFERVQL